MKIKVWLSLLLTAAVCLLCSAPALALDAQEIVARNRQAIGGEAALSMQRAVYTEATVKAMGLEGTARAWSAYPNKYRQDVDLGIMRQVSGFDGEVAWLKDMNGQVVRQTDPGAMAKAITEAFISNGGYLRPEENPCTLEFAGEVQDGELALLAVTMTPQGGKPVTVFFDRETFLIRRIDLEEMGMKFKIYLEDYRPEEGVLLAHLSRQVGPDPLLNSEQRLTKIMFCETADPALFALPAEQTRAEFPPGQDRVVLPFRTAGNLVFIDARLNGGEPLAFLLDTGAESSVLNRRLAERLGLKGAGQLPAQGAGGMEAVSLVDVDTLDVGGVVLRSLTMAAADLDPLGAGLGMELNGVLGYEFFSSFVVSFDYERSLVELYPFSSYGYAGSGERIPTRVLGKLLTVDGLVDGDKPGRFVVDTGAATTLEFQTQFAEQHKLFEPGRAHVSEKMMGLGGVKDRVTTRVDSFRLGSFVIEKPIVGLSSAQEGLFSIKEIDGLIGQGILSRFKVIFDYAMGELILERNRDFAAPFLTERTGLRWKPAEGGCYVVQYVPANTPAAEAGVLPGDRVFKVNGKRVSKLTDEVLTDLMNGPPGSVLKLKVWRGKKTVTVKLVLRDYL